MDYQEKIRLIRTLVDLIIFIITVIGMIFSNGIAQPFQRGFFCDDESLKYPFKPSSISYLFLMLSCVGIATFAILAVEGIRYKNNADEFPAVRVGPCKVHGYVYACYCTIGLFVFGMGITKFCTDMTKPAVGRLRPYFLTVCNPNYAELNCSGYVEGDVCDPSVDAGVLTEARQSFISGHSSLAMFAGVYLTIYLHAHLRINRYTYLLKPVLQTVSLLLALYVGLSRISDYKHHWSDVLAGYVTGALVAIFVTCLISDMFKRKSGYPANNRVDPNKNACSSAYDRYGATEMNDSWALDP